MARTYGRRPGPSAAFAAAFNALPETRQRAIVTELQNALRQVTQAQTTGTKHEPFGKPGQPYFHYHEHHVSGDRTHWHVHSHEADGLHIGHSHDPDDTKWPDRQDAPDARQPRHVRFEHGGMSVLNSARPPQAGDPWERLERTAAEIRRQGRQAW